MCKVELSLGDDLRPFYAVAETDPAFAPLVQELYGYHQVKFLMPFENACWAILSQRNLISVSHNVKRLSAPYGDHAGYWAHYLRAAT
jgi:DNA-3-methyladenine glycosylase II